MRTILTLLTVFFVPVAMGADYAREKRWADEIVPGLVIGKEAHITKHLEKDLLK